MPPSLLPRRLVIMPTCDQAETIARSFDETLSATVALDGLSALDSWQRTLAAGELLMSRRAASGGTGGPLRDHGLEVSAR
jgi:hypothetical protein